MSLRHYIASLHWVALVYPKIHLPEDILLPLATIVLSVLSVVLARSEVPLLVVYTMFLTVVLNPPILPRAVVAIIHKRTAMDMRTSVLEMRIALHIPTLIKVHLIKLTAYKTWLITWT